MRRALAVLAVLLLVVVAVDQYVRAQVRSQVATGAARGFSASAADVDLDGLLVLPQMLGGRLAELRIQLDDAVIGDPPVRATAMSIVLSDVAVELPPPPVLDEVAVGGGSAVVSLHEREVERLLQRDRPGWAVRIDGSAIRATGEVEGVTVTVTVEVTPEGDGLRLRAREVDAGPLGPEGARSVAARFDTTIALAGLPELVRITGATAGPSRLDLQVVIDEGVLDLR